MDSKVRYVLNSMRRFFRLKNLIFLIICYYSLKWTILHENSYIMQGGPRPAPVDRFEFDHSQVKYFPYELMKMYTDQQLKEKEQLKEINWHEYAYVTYATDYHYLCNAIMNLARLKDSRKMGNSSPTSADLVLLYRSDFRYAKGKPRSEQTTVEGQLLADAVDKYGIKIRPVPVLWFKSDISSWAASFTKYWVFDMVEYKRIVYFDSDATFLNHMDQYFFLPESLIYMPVSYQAFQNQEILLTNSSDSEYDILHPLETVNERLARLGKIMEMSTSPKDMYNLLPSANDFFSKKVLNNSQNQEKFRLSNHIMIIQPNHRFFQNLLSYTNSKKLNEYDMDVFNNFINIQGTIQQHKPSSYWKRNQKLKNAWLIDSGKYHEPDEYIPLVTIMAHQNFGMLTGELRHSERSKHDYYLSDMIDYPQIDNFQIKYDLYIEEMKEVESQRRKIIYKHATNSKEGKGEDSEEEREEELKALEATRPSPVKVPYWRSIQDASVYKGESLDFIYGWDLNRTMERNDLLLIHFSDYPIPKPWKVQYQNENLESRIRCSKDNEYSIAGFKLIDDCDCVLIWNDLYVQFGLDRKEYCGLDLIP